MQKYAEFSPKWSSTCAPPQHSDAGRRHVGLTVENCAYLKGAPTGANTRDNCRLLIFLDRAHTSPPPPARIAAGDPVRTTYNCFGKVGIFFSIIASHKDGKCVSGMKINKKILRSSDIYARLPVLRAGKFLIYIFARELN